ncbi:MAG TPA: hypothetical protein VGD40_06050 [Chryseosolibacter sp.]
MRIRISLVLTLTTLWAYAQPNCNVYKLSNNQSCYEACVIATREGAPQGSKASQLQFDSAISICPALDYAYFEKAVPYLKRGDFITWKKLIDQAVALNPTAHLGYRGWCRYQFVRDYRGAIRDFEKLDSLLRFDIGYSINGDYHLNIAKALCYKAIGQKAKAIEIIERQLAVENYSPLTYDYFHLGVLKMETGDLNGGIDYLNKSIALNDYFAEAHYYLGLIYKKQNLPKAHQESMRKAKSYYEKGYKRFDPYTHPMDKVYFAQIEKEINLANSGGTSIKN